MLVECREVTGQKVAHEHFESAQEHRIIRVAHNNNDNLLFSIDCVCDDVKWVTAITNILLFAVSYIFVREECFTNKHFDSSLSRNES